ncbi:hypothetical protein [Actinomadura chibensis]|nr:hypothetical protein [Actinomadura chibensis]
MPGGCPKRREFLHHVTPFESLTAAQEALDRRVQTEFLRWTVG